MGGGLSSGCNCVSGVGNGAHGCHLCAASNSVDNFGTLLVEKGERPLCG